MNLDKRLFLISHSWNCRKMSEKLVIIDTDAGTDDAWGLFLAAAAQREFGTSRFRILAVTTCCGNTTVENVANNVTRTFDTVNDTTIPIYKGMDGFLTSPFRFIEEPPYHGEDGFGDANLPPIPTRVQSAHSVEAILQFAQAFQGRVTMVCFGPLTNLAMAVKLQPLLRTWLKDIYILGGNIEGVGNVVGVNSAAEFNFFVDPEAVQVVFDSFEGCPIYDLPWEVMLRSISTHEFRTEVLGSMGTPTIELMNAIEAKNIGEVTDHWLAPDPILMACFIDPDVMLQVAEIQRYDIERNGELTRGMMVLDRNPNSEKPKNVRVIMEIDLRLLESMLIWAAGGPPPRKVRLRKRKVTSNSSRSGQLKRNYLR